MMVWRCLALGCGAVALIWLLNGAVRPLVVASGSMEPHLPVGSIAFFRALSGGEKPVPGQVIAFIAQGNRPVGGEGVVVTHRIVSVERGEGSIGYRTRGDANRHADARVVPLGSVRGVEAFALPYLGYPLLWGREPLGFLLLVAVPALILLAGEVGKLAGAWGALRGKAA